MSVYSADYPSPAPSDPSARYDYALDSVGPARVPRRQSTLKHPHLNGVLANSPPPERPYHPITPTSALPSPYSPYDRRSRTRSMNISGDRQHSPAVSPASSVSSLPPETTRSTAPRPPPYQKSKGHKKHRLRDADRKSICQYHLDNPNARQEDIGSHFGVERSTISKILKEKEKWLNISAEEERNDLSAKHRPSKFPEIEEAMLKHLQAWSEQKQPITDGLIRDTALHIAATFGVSKDKFKSSSGWIENFKHRHDIRKNEWMRAHKYTAQISHITHQSIDQPSILSSLTSQTPSIMPYDHNMSDSSSGGPSSHYSEQASASSDSLSSHPHSLSSQPHSPWGTSASPDSQSHDIVLDPSLQQSSDPHQHLAHPDSYAASYSQTLDNSNHVSSAPVLLGPYHRPTLAEAEDAINLLITFIDTSGRGILKDDERALLADVKCALFQAHSGIPYDRIR
ncbi:hypothetical protein CVT24_008018 [Panaeolus cyanescens]|uniref:HTH CENPB-type domain-containing protein n=1 Tax=Panaeolus cyanescens TaxID=181874 RepID=A0A409YQW7_9AGAR|nr:hypothetical protein CVT24_008018 [Panaeolus cyanescens]